MDQKQLTVLESILLRISNIEALISQKQPQQYYSIEEAAKILNLSKSTLYKKHSKGLIESIGSGKKLRFTYDHIQRFISDTDIKPRYKEASDIDNLAEKISRRIGGVL